MVVVCATDDNFVQHCTIMLVSLLYNNKDVDIYLLTEGLTERNQVIITNEVKRYGGNIHYCIVDSSIISKFPMPNDDGLNHISRATYYRLLIPTILPSTLQKAIYFDCDIIINNSIVDLWNIDLSGYALAASKQIGYGFLAERLNYPIEYGYFNAGVNVINLSYWRENNVVVRLLDYITSNYANIKYHDQDTLNAVLYKETLHISPKWNMTTWNFQIFLNSRGDSRDGVVINSYDYEKEEIKKTKHSPIVIHFVSKPKPWMKNCVHPHYKLYYKYAHKTSNYANLKEQNIICRKCAILKYSIIQIGAQIKQSLLKNDLTCI